MPSCWAAPDVLVPQRALAFGRQLQIALAEGGGHPYDEIGNDPGGEEETDPHAEDMQIEVASLPVVRVRQRHEEEPEHRVTEKGDTRDAPRTTGRQERGGNHQREQVQGHEGIRPPAREIQNAGQRGGVGKELREQKCFAHGRPLTHPHPRPGVEQTGGRENHAQGGQIEALIERKFGNGDRRSHRDECDGAQHGQALKVAPRGVRERGRFLRGHGAVHPADFIGEPWARGAALCRRLVEQNFRSVTIIGSSLIDEGRYAG